MPPTPDVKTELDEILKDDEKFDAFVSDCREEKREENPIFLREGIKYRNSGDQSNRRKTLTKIKSMLALDD